MNYPLNDMIADVGEVWEEAHREEQRNIWTETAVKIIRRQWKHRNHDVFGAVARHQIKKCVDVLRHYK